MVELRASRLPTAEPLRLHRGPGTVVQPMARGLVFLAALSLPVIGCLAADRLHGGTTHSVQASAPHRSEAANGRITAPVQFAQVKFGRGLDLR